MLTKEKGHAEYQFGIVMPKVGTGGRKNIIEDISAKPSSTSHHMQHGIWRNTFLSHTFVNIDFYLAG